KTHAQVKLVGLEVVEHEARKLRGEDFRENHADAQHERHDCNNYREGFLRVFLSFLRQESCVDGHEGDGDCATSDQVSEDIGDLKGGDVGVRGGPCAEGPGSICLANVSHDA